MRIMILGPPRAGKATQSRMLSSALCLSAVSVDALVQDHTARRTPLGQRAARSIDLHEPIPHPTLHAIVLDGLTRAKSRHGWILSGYPHTAQQFSDLRDWCANCGQTLDLAIVLGVSERESLRRLCTASKPPTPESAEVEVRSTYTAFNDFMRPLMASLDSMRILRVVDGEGEVEEVHRRCLAVAVAAVKARAGATG